MVGIKLESGESIIGTTSGVVTARDFGRKPEERGRGSDDGVDGFKGVPWEPYPGAGTGFEIKSKVRLPVVSERITINIEGKDEHVPRRMRIASKDLAKFGLTVGRAACRASSRGSGG